ncbi:MAG: cation transporter [Planctomycetes bacterium]|nr:cation transporter [Planctomycetota bacterium]
MKMRPTNNLPEGCSDCLNCSDKIMLWSIGGSFFLAIIKLLGGVYSSSSGLMADGIQSLSCVIGSTIIMFSIRISKKQKDMHFPFGYGKVEYLVSMIIFSLLMGLGVYISGSSLLLMLNGNYDIPGVSGVPIAAISIFVNFLIYKYSICAGKKTGSNGMIANAYQAKADLYSSTAVLAGIALAQLGTVFAICDPLAAFAVGLLIIKDGVTHWKQNLQVILDKVPDPEYRSKLQALVLNEPLGATLEYVRLKRTGEKYWLGMGLNVSDGGGLDVLEETTSHLKSVLHSRMSWIGHVEFFLNVPDEPVIAAPLSDTDSSEDETQKS